MNVRGRRWNFLIYYLLFAAAISLVAGRQNWITYYKLTREGVETQGRLTAKACSSPAPLNYRFSAGGIEYEGSGRDGYGNQPCVSLKPGDPVLVSYLSGQPRVNLPGSAMERLVNETVSIAIAALFIPFIILFVIFIVLKRLGK